MRRKILIPTLAFLAGLAIVSDAGAATFPVTRFDDTAATAAGSATGAGDGAGVSGDLRNTILLANSVGGSGNTINFVCLTAPGTPCIVTLNGPLPPITSNLTVDGIAFGNVIIDGNNSYRVFFVDAGTVTLTHLEIRNASAAGGIGGPGAGPGGGGAGFGAGLFVNQAAAVVTVQSTYFLNCNATGGTGGAASGVGGTGGGGGLGFAGGPGTSGNGGAGGVTGLGLPGTFPNGGNGGPGGGGGAGAVNSTGTPGTGGSAYATNGSGSPGGGAEGVFGGDGGFGGGGGGGTDNGGNGGFGGGGGGSGFTSSGNGGFGGGGGGAANPGAAGSSAAAVGGVNGGSGGSDAIPNSAGGGGGGAAAGPAIFVNAGSITLLNTTGSTFSATAGVGGPGASGGSTGAAGTANSTAVFNYGGSVNGSTTKGAIAGALPGGLPATHFSLVPSINSVQSFQQVDVTVTALDINNNPATGYNGNVNFTSTEDPNLVYSLCQNNCPTANSSPPTTWTNGVATWDFSPKLAGTFTITATDTVDSSIIGTSSAITCTPAPIDGLTLTGIPATATPGTPFNFTVTAHDLFNNTDTNNSTDTVAITSSDGAANLPAPAHLVNGVVSFAVTLNTTGNQTVTATDATATVTQTSSSISVNALPPSITVSFSPSTVQVGGTKTTTLTVTVTNPNSIALTGIAFSNTYPAGVVGDVISADGCTTGHRTFTSSGITVTAVTLAAGRSCSEAVQMHASGAGTITDTTSTVTATESLTAGPAASATLTAATATTTLAVTAASTPVTTVATGTVVTLTATVEAGVAPITSGVVNFCDATAAFCEDIHVVGSAHLTSAGTAVLKFVPGLGSHSYKAVFTGTASFPAASSAASALAVTGTDQTTTAITQGGSAGNYTLTGIVSAFGIPTPTGQLSFEDQTNGNAVAGTANLDNTTLASVFAPVQTANTGNNPYPLAAADLNGDGIPDIVVPNSGQANVSVFLGNGDGTFAAGVTYATGSSPYSAAVGDFNGDGIPDIAVANYGDNTVSILIGNGNGTFGIQKTFGTGSFPASVAIGDFNNDGISDLAVADYSAGPGAVSILLGVGDGTFHTARSYTAGNSPYTIAVADFNGDGFPDVVTSNSGSSNISVFLNNDDGTFQTQTTYPVATGGGAAWSVATGDFNADGFPDIAVASSGNVSVFLNKGDGSGTFNAAVGYSAGNTAYMIAVGDFKVDGKADLAVANVNGGNISILTGSGTGTFGSPVNYSIGSGVPQGLAVGDFNGDGRPDLAVPLGGANKLGIFLGELTESATATGVNVAGSGTQQVFASYPGDANYNSSVSATTALTGTAPPSLIAAFGAPSIAIGASASLTFTVTNANATVGLTGIGFADTLPAGLVVSTPNGLTGSCGTITAVAGSSSVSMSGLSLAASGTCAFSLNVTGITAGVQNNVTSTVTSNEGGAGGTASAGITVNKDTQTIAFGALPAHTYGDAPLSVSATATSGQTVTFSVTSGPCSVVVTTVTITGAGSCVIAANQSGNATYSAAPAVPETLTVNKAALTVTANNANVVTGFTLPTFTASYSGFVNGDTAAVLSGAPGLSTTATAGSAPGSYPITVTAGTLTTANYTFSLVNGTLTISPQPIPPPTLTVSPSALVLQYALGILPTSFTQTLTVNSTSGGSFAVTSSAPWLVAPSTGTAPGPYTVTLNMAGLAPGLYQANLNLTSSIGSAQVPVTLTVTSPASVGAQPSPVQLGAVYGTTAPVSQNVQLTLTPASTNFTFTTSTNAPWLSVTTSPGNTPAAVQVSANPTGLPAATYQGSVIVTVPGALNSPYSIPVSFTVSGTGLPGQTGVDNSASFGPALAAPNTLLTLFSPLLGCTPNPQVFVNGVAASITFANSGQINFVTPGDLFPVTPATIQVVCNGNPVETVSLPEAQTNPAIFTENGSGKGQGSIVNSNGTVNTAANPASRSDYISVYVTGFGPYNPPGTNGLQTLVYPVTATIGGISATVLYAGNAPTETSGLQQINILVPAGVQPGPGVPITLTANGVATQAGVTVAIQ